MNNTESRKAFEEWAKARGLLIAHSLFRESCYADLGTQKAFEAWQASRSKPIRLPEPTVANYDVVIPYGDVKRAIEAAGYKCE
jgi:hypothetical protein